MQYQWRYDIQREACSVCKKKKKKKLRWGKECAIVGTRYSLKTLEAK